MGVAVIQQGLPRWLSGKESACQCRVTVSIFGFRRSLGEGNGNPFQHCCLEKPHGQRWLMGYSPWGYTKSQTQLSDWRMQCDPKKLPLLNRHPACRLWLLTLDPELQLLPCDSWTCRGSMRAWDYMKILWAHFVYRDDLYSHKSFIVYITPKRVRENRIREFKVVSYYSDLHFHPHFLCPPTRLIT